ncbi:AAA family ATPase [Pontibacter sp. KCTC 32443]|uniref:DEAD/DEAH box helicase n=1 Tax=Pontibacter TaxID=323449 RepID=UPI00164D154A|nr:MULTISPECIES: AAA domain-containing protein [Pontibacter]MBC5772800.1 AAA family ATPase [Pontibacter sp. KCTC 32443]
MEVEEIRNTCIDSADKYLKYLELHKKGVQEVSVFDLEINSKKDLYIKLRLSAKLFDTESIFFKVKANLFDTTQVKVVEYNSDKNLLLVKPNKELQTVFRFIKAGDLFVVSDLKFLVRRVKVWYEKNGNGIGLPQKASVLKNSSNQIKFLPGLEPSQNQKAALSNIFHNPFSYIWGAPGTGKTQFVLSYAILHYILNNKRVAILAPTNNALEQVLRGVIKMLDKAKVERTQVLRLGTPSKNFAEDYPDVCEQKGVQKKLEEIDNQISLFERVIAYEQNRQALEKAKESLPLFNKFKKYKNKKQKSQSNFENATLKRKSIEIAIHRQEETLSKVDKERIALKASVNSFTNKLYKFFSSGPTTTEQKLERAEVRTQQAISTLISLKDSLQPQLQAINQYTNELKGVEESITELKEIIFEKLEKQINLLAVASHVNENNYIAVKDQFEEALEEELKQVEVDSQFLSDYQHYSEDQINSTLARLNNEREKIAAFSTEQRLKEVKVIACTLDSYIGNFHDKKLDVSHIFLDEAGYANVIKALTLFHNKVPITFLGDHKQLPPVCEINDSDIEKNPDYKNVFIWAQSAIFVESLFLQSKDQALLDYFDNKDLSCSAMERSQLSETFRFGRSLAKVLAHHVYADSFTSSVDQGDTQILFVDAKKVDAFKSRTSKNEVEAITQIVSQLVKAQEENFVILTPYSKQLKLLGQRLPQQRNDLKLSTVHGSQGKEWHTVILSVVDTNDMWFVDSKKPISKGLNLVNTAVSRAQKQLIIVCDKEFWSGQSGQLITDLIAAGNPLSMN